MYTYSQASSDASASPVTLNAILLPLGTIQIAGVNDSGYSLLVPSAFARFISLILRCSVRRLMPSFLAAAVTLPFVAASA
jgi:hypothetical protein